MRRLILILVIVSISAGCRRQTESRGELKELETVDVGVAPDAGLTTESDEQARREAVRTAGVLPSDFPSGLPTFAPGSIVDFGPGFVDVDTSVSISEVRSSLSAQITRAGWSAERLGDRALSFSRSGRSVEIVLTDLSPGTRIRYSY